MIPRLKPFLYKEDLFAIVSRRPEAVPQFEQAFARTFSVNQAIAYSYGRSALWALFKTLDLRNAEVIMPAYTCSVVAQAIVLSDNIPRFVDVTLHDYNMDLEQVEAQINERTRAVIATHLFGYPLDIDRLQTIVDQAEARYNHKIWIVQDCAHSFGAYWQGNSVWDAGDIGLFGSNISKTITSIFGGMLTVNDTELADRLRAWRDAQFKTPGRSKAWKRRLYLLATYIAFNRFVYGFVNWLQEETSLLKSFTDAYHLDDNVHFPPDFRDQMISIEGQVGLAQLDKYKEIIRRRQANAQYYHEQLQDITAWNFPPQIDGATYSHYVIRVPDRDAVLEKYRKQGIQLGQLIEYSVPHLASYKSYTEGQAYPNSLLCSQHMVNLPVHASLTVDQRKYIVDSIKADNALTIS